jgi:hypothetical protein
MVLPGSEYFCFVLGMIHSGSEHQRPKRGGFLLPASPRPEKSFPRFALPRKKFSPLRPPRLLFLFSVPTSPRPEKSSPRFTPPRFLKVFLLTALTPKTETERIFHSPLRFAPKKFFPASPRPVSVSGEHFCSVLGMVLPGSEYFCLFGNNISGFTAELFS